MNTPNKITMLRLFLVPVFLIFFFSNLKYNNLYALMVFILASSTDGIDGYLARKNNEITILGQFLDPLVDKILVSAALIALVDKGYISSWVVIVILSREFAVTGLRAIAVSRGITIDASSLGKMKTFSQMTAISVNIMKDFLYSIIPLPLGEITLYFALFMTILSGLDYFYKNREVFREED